MKATTTGTRIADDDVAVLERLDFTYDTLKERIETQARDYDSQMAKTTTVFGFVTGLSGFYLGWADTRMTAAKALELLFMLLCILLLGASVPQSSILSSGITRRRRRYQA